MLAGTLFYKTTRCGPLDGSLSGTVNPLPKAYADMISSLITFKPNWAAWVLFALVALVLALVYSFMYEDRPHPKIPVVGIVPGDFLNMKTKERFVRYANQVMKQGIQEVGAHCNKLPREPPY